MLGMMLSACAARTQPMGSSLGEPALEAGAIIAPDGYRLPLRSWLPPEGVPTRTVIVALHGFNDYSRGFEAAGRYFAGRGVAVYAYDQRGFGACADPGVWPDRQTLEADARAALSVIGAAHPGLPLFLLGESMGGAVAISLMTGDLMTGPGAPRVAGVILSAPAVWGLDVMAPFPRIALRVAYAMFPGWVVTAPPELGIRPTDNDDVLRELAADPLVIKGSRVDTLHGLTDLMGHALHAYPSLKGPVMTLYGGHEQVLPEEPVARVLEMAAAMPNVTVKRYPDGYHMLMRDRQAIVVLEDMGAWVDAHLNGA